MYINRRKLRMSLGSRAVRRAGTKQGKTLNVRPRVRLAALVRAAQAGK